MKYATERFWNKVEMTNACWPWIGYCNPDGYAQFSAEGRQVYVHRYAYEQLVGPIPPGLTLDHLCRVRRCVRPDHLEPVTQRENNLRGDTIPGRNARKTHCLRGHPFDEENTYLILTGGRRCRECQAKYMRDYQRARPGRRKVKS